MRGMGSWGRQVVYMAGGREVHNSEQWTGLREGRGARLWRAAIVHRRWHLDGCEASRSLHIQGHTDMVAVLGVEIHLG